MSWLGQVRFRLSAVIVERLFSYDTPALARKLEDLGIRRGDAVMVHSSLRARSGYRDRPVDMIDVLKEAVGRDGLLIMPSMPYTDSSKAYLLRGTEMDVCRTPSQMGLLTEVFRRSSNVQRSLSPTHPLLAWGDRAAWFVSGHDRTNRPFGAASPFQRLLDLDGKILCIDVVPETITFTHFLEDRLREMLPFPLYESSEFEGSVRDIEGHIRSVPTCVLSDESRVRRCEEALWRQARSAGILQHRRLGNTKLMLLRCRELTALVEDIFAHGGGYFVRAR